MLRDNLVAAGSRMMPVDRRPVVVSLTPMSLSADSRTLKQVMSVHRFGFNSIVVEGTQSRFEKNTLPFDVISIRPREDAGGAAALVAKDRHSSDSAVLPEANALRQFFRRLPVARFVYRLMPGSQKLASIIEFWLQRVIAERGGANGFPYQISAGKILGALPRTAFLVAVDVAKSAVYLVMRPLYHALANPLEFAKYLRGYLREHFVRVLAVTPHADLYYLHSFYQFPAVWVLCRWHGAKLIYDAHDFYLHQLDDPGVSSYWKKWVIPFERIIERACVRFADDVVTVNDGIAGLMRSQFGCEALILRNVHDFRLDHQPVRTIRETIGLPPSAFLVVSIGNHKSGTVLEPVLDALTALPSHVHLGFLGGYYPALDEAAASRGLSGRVHLLGRVLPQEVVPFARSADAAILLYFGRTPNYPNLLPNGLFQSIAAELPLVYPDLEQIRRLAERYRVGIMADPQKPAEIEAALRGLLEDNEGRVGFQRNLRAAGRELCWEREEQVLKRILHAHLQAEPTIASVVKDKTAG